MRDSSGKPLPKGKPTPKDPTPRNPLRKGGKLKTKTQRSAAAKRSLRILNEKRKASTKENA